MKKLLVLLALLGLSLAGCIVPPTNVDFGEGFSKTKLNKGEVIAQVKCGIGEEEYAIEYRSFNQGSRTDSISSGECVGLDGIGSLIAVATSITKVYTPECAVENGCIYQAVPIFDRYMLDDLRVVVWAVWFVKGDMVLVLE